MIQSSRFPGSVPAARVLMFGFMNSQDYRTHSYALQLSNMKYMIASEHVVCVYQCVDVCGKYIYYESMHVCLGRGRNRVKSFFFLFVFLKRGEGEEGETKKQDSWRGRRALPQLQTPVYLMMHRFHPAIPHYCCLTSSLHSLL